MDYVQQRKQFGSEIGRFQAVQGVFADMAMDVEADRLRPYQVRQMMSRLRADYEVSIAKAFATEMGVRVSSNVKECSGAMGRAKEMKLERCIRDARVWMGPVGAIQTQCLAIGRELTGYSAVRG